MMTIRPSRDDGFVGQVCRLVESAAKISVAFSIGADLKIAYTMVRISFVIERVDGK
jgi:hypothetical protein